MPLRQKLTKTSIEAIVAPATGRLTVYDTITPKLAVRVTAAGSKSFYVVKRNAARMEWLKLGGFPDMSVEQAQRAALKALGAYADGDSPAAARRDQRAAGTLQDAFDDYLQLYAIPKGKKTVDDIRALWERCVGAMPVSVVKKHGRPRTKHAAGVDWSNRKIDSITSREVEEIHVAIGRQHPTMANRVLELLSAILGRSARRNDNPARGIEPFGEKHRERFIQSGELPRFFQALAADTSVDFQHFILLALLTGARRTNVLAMRWEQISFERTTWRIPDTKNGEPMTVPLVSEAVEILNARKPQASGWVFPAESKVGYMTPPKKRWRALLQRAEIADLRVHDLRRSLGSWQAITGASLTIIGKSLGHRSVEATKIYAQLDVDPVRASMATATSAMLVAAGVKQPAKVTLIRRKKTAA